MVEFENGKKDKVNHGESVSLSNIVLTNLSL